MQFQISPLPASRFSHLFKLQEDELKAQAIEIHVSDGAFPCRVSLEDVPEGQKVYLLNYEHHSAATPYRASHAIFVREHAVEACLPTNDIPPMLVSRLLSVRAFDTNGHMLDADVVDGEELTAEIDRAFANPKAHYLHVHFARRGCYAARIDRA